MKKAGLIACTVVSLFALVGSSIWEGAAGVAQGGTLPGSGLYIATNSFPINTVVDVTNLATGQTTRVVTSAPLETTPGLLAVLSIDAAEAIGIQGRTLGRIRMTQPPDVVAFSRFGQRRRPPGVEGERGPAGRGGRGPAPAPAFATFLAADDTAGEGAVVPEDAIIDLPLAHHFAAAPLVVQEYVAAEEDAVMAALAESGLEEAHDEENLPQEDAVLALMRGFFPEPSFEVVDDAFAPETVAEGQESPEAAFTDSEHILALVPAEARPPAEDVFVPDPDYVIAGIAPVQHPGPFQQEFITPADEAAWLPTPAAFVPTPLLPVRMISRLQAGKYYLQIAAYSNVGAVQYELSRLQRIDSSLSSEVVVMRGENPEHGTVYQILIGPLNLGESGALLHRFRSTTHRDAFIRSGG